MGLPIVVPLDGSELAETALPWALAIAERRGSQPVICTVVEVSTEFAAWMTSDNDLARNDLDRILATRREYLDDVCRRFGMSNPVTDIRVGTAAREIVDCATEQSDGTALIVMSTHGRGGLTRLALGSVALEVVTAYQGPILAVRDEDLRQNPQVGRLLIPVDGSRFSEQAIDQSLAVLGDPAPHLHIVQVLGSPDWAASVMRQGLAGEYLRASRELAEDYVQHLNAGLTERGYHATSEVRMLGNVASQILECASENESDMIAMATRGRGGLGRMVLGSVADGVVRESSRPVLLIHSDAG